MIVPVPVLLPELGESVTGGTLVAWIVAVGDTVREGEPLVEIATDKVDTEIPSPLTGTVLRLAVEVGSELAVGDVLCEVEPTDVPAAPAAPAAPEVAPASAPATAPASAVESTPESAVESTPESAVPPGSPEPSPALIARISPLARRRIRERDLDPTLITGTGPGGRLTAEDVDAAQDAQAPAAGRPSSSRTEPLSRTRKVIAERMLASMQTTAQLTSAVEADVTRLMRLRSSIGAVARDRIGSSLSPLAFIAHATVRALADHPILNASIDTEAGTVTYHADVNLGIAVDAPAGLIVPVIRDARDLGVVELQQRIADVAARARDKRITVDDLSGGTFTITNTGSRGSLFDTPIINPPEVGILATPTIEKRPVVFTDEDGTERIAVRHRTYLCLSYDHRLVDGADAARFLTDVAALLDSDAWGPDIEELIAAAAAAAPASA
jgi:pyruvate dehydrogenase E2 component (dihydrolipoamide acetyltransferase)